MSKMSLEMINLASVSNPDADWDSFPTSRIEMKDWVVINRKEVNITIYMIVSIRVAPLDDIFFIMNN